MKIESGKNNHNDKKESSVKKSESALHKFLDQKEISDSNSKQGAFEKILAETRKNGSRVMDLDPDLKNLLPDSDMKSDESNGELELILCGNNEIEEKPEHESESGGERHEKSESQPLPSVPVLPATAKSSAENPIAAARSILHVADLERIVATIRTENFKTSKHVEIALKHSVLEGLKIRIAIDENGRLKAEFLSQNEQIRKQLEARKRELNQVFVQRAVNFSVIEIVGSAESENRPKMEKVS